MQTTAVSSQPLLAAEETPRQLVTPETFKISSSHPTNTKKQVCSGLSAKAGAAASSLPLSARGTLAPCGRCQRLPTRLATPSSASRSHVGRGAELTWVLGPGAWELPVALPPRSDVSVRRQLAPATPVSQARCKADGSAPTASSRPSVKGVTVGFTGWSWE